MCDPNLANIDNLLRGLLSFLFKYFQDYNCVIIQSIYNSS